MAQDNEDLFDPAELRAWEKDPRGKPFWDELRKRGNAMMSGMRQAVNAGEAHKAGVLEGNLQAVEETLQLVDIIIQEYRDAEEDEKETQ